MGPISKRRAVEVDWARRLTRGRHPRSPRLSRIGLAFRPFWKCLNDDAFAQGVEQVERRSPAGADVRILALLQRDGRLVDFLQEEIDALLRRAGRRRRPGHPSGLPQGPARVPDDRAGAGRPTRSQPVTVRPDFDPAAIRLTGNVAGSPPFRGVLKHHGWRVKSVQLPGVPPSARTDRRSSPRPRSRSPDRATARVGTSRNVESDHPCRRVTSSASTWAPPTPPSPTPTAARPSATRRRADPRPADPPGRRPGETSAERPVLPSFLYLPGREGVRRPGRSTCPGRRRPTGVVGTFAREHGAKVPGRLVGSAKSWLSHAGVDRRAPILPWNAPEDVAKVSPVEASAAYLAHLRDAWNADAGEVGRRPPGASRTSTSPSPPRSTPRPAS